MHWLPLLNLLIYGALVLIGLVDWRSGRDSRASFIFGATFLTLLVSTCIGLFIEQPFGARQVQLIRVTVALDALFPALLILLQRHLGGWSLRTCRAVMACSIGVGALTLLGPATPVEPELQGAWGITWIVVYMLYWLVATATALVGFLKLGSGRAGIVRRRMQTLAGGVGVFLAMVVVIGVLGTSEPTWYPWIFGQVAGVLFWIGFRPPGWVRELWRGSEREELRRSFARFLEVSSERDALDALLPPLTDVLGASGVLVLGRTGDVLLRHGFDDQRAEEVVQLAASLGDGVDRFEAGDIILVRGGALTTIVLLSTATPLFGEEEMSTVAAVSAFAELAIERGRTMDSLRERDGQLRAAHELAALGSWEWEIDIDCVHVSPALAGMLGIDAAVTSMSFDDMLGKVHPADRPQLRALVDRVISGGEPFLHDHRMGRVDGSELHVHSRGQLTRSGGRRRRRVTGIVQDITERKLAEEHLRELYERERELTRRLQVLDDVKNNILAAVSHELRTPLTSVIGFALTLRDRDVQLAPLARAEIIDHLATEALRLEQLLGDLLDLDQLQRGVVTPRLASASLAGLVDRVLAALPDSHGVTRDVEDSMVLIDESKMDRVLTNLVENARKHTPAGTVVTISARRIGQVARIEVVDDGQGVPADQRERIFLPFDRGCADLDHAPGTGVGLALVRQFAELHGGSAWVEDAPSRGARFVVEVPAGPVQDVS